MNKELLQLHEKILMGLSDIDLPTQFELDLLDCYLNASQLIREKLRELNASLN
jgi:hypothetical protein